ncbi:Uncharacterised protein [Mycobacteroides abscessus subsp. abscessus]|nr:Uncharacterised protein [Mycobacteroides abscessus subsp. abscessus]
MRRERDDPTLTQGLPQVIEVRVDGDVGEVVVVESGATQLRVREVEAEGFDDVEVRAGDGGEPDRVAGVAGDLRGVEDDVDAHMSTIISSVRVDSVLVCQ